MRTEDIGDREPSNWVPISSPQVLAALGKLGEELGEASAIISRCIIQGLGGKNPESGEGNWAALEKELADVRGLSALVIRQLGLDEEAIADRAEKKRNMKANWIKDLPA
jgi:NTP pyrophosphatase (non-canonical NTP hydrolase)